MYDRLTRCTIVLHARRLSSAAHLTPFEKGYSYTFGATIDVTVVSGNPDEDNALDLSHRTAEFRELVFGLGGADQLTLGRGDDFAYGGDGDDMIDGGAGADFADGGDGTDTFTLASSTGGVHLIANSATVHGGQAGIALTDNVASSDATGDMLIRIEKIEGSSFGDYIDAKDVYVDVNGGRGNDTLYGSLEKEEVQTEWGAYDLGSVVEGGAGDDLLVGGDWLNGGSGNDTLDATGWLGDDRYSFKAAVYLEDIFGQDQILSDHDLAVNFLNLDLTYGQIDPNSGVTSLDVTGVTEITFQDTTGANYKFIFEEKQSSTASSQGRNVLGDLAIANDVTGESILIRDIIMWELIEDKPSERSDLHLFLNMPRLYAEIFGEENFYFDEKDVIFGSVAAYDLWPAA